MYIVHRSNVASRVISFIALVTVICAFAILFPKKTLAYSNELVSNGGFESGASGWVGDTGYIGYNNVVSCHGGLQCVYIRTVCSNVPASYAVSQVVEIPSSAESAGFSVWEWIEGNGNVKISSYDNPSDVWYQQFPFMGTTGNTWTQLTVDLTAHKGNKAIVQLQFGYDCSHNPSLFDDVRLVVAVTDTTPPTSVVITTPLSADSSTGYFLSGATINLAASDNDGGSGVSSTKYKWDDAGTYSTFTSSITAPNGIHTLYYYSIDKDGNSENAHSLIIKVGTPPTAPTPVTTPTNSAINTNSVSNINSGSSNTNTSTRNTNSTKHAVTKPQNTNISQVQTVTNVPHLTNASNANTPTNIALPDSQLANQNSNATVPVTQATVQAEKSPSNTAGYVLGTSGTILGIGFWFMRRLLNR